MRRVLGFLFVLAGASSAIARGDAITTPAKPSVATAKPAVAGTMSAKPTAQKSATAQPDASTKPPTQKPPAIALAPADEYFGPLKMSVLGIRNEIHDLAIRYDVRADIDHALAKRIMGTAVMTEASVADLEKKYPADNQLARDVYLLQHLYAKIEYDEARNKAKFCAQWLLTRYGASWYAKNLRSTMTRDGVPIPTGAPTPIKLEVPPTTPPASAPPATSPPSTTPSAAPATSTVPAAATKPTGAKAPASTPAPVSSPAAEPAKATPTTAPVPSPPLQ